MKPKPFALLNHLTLPLIRDTFLNSARPGGHSPKPRCWYLVRFFIDLPRLSEKRSKCHGSRFHCLFRSLLITLAVVFILEREPGIFQLGYYANALDTVT